jgi:two-component system nitrate/nitrite response regulator NarL
MISELVCRAPEVKTIAQLDEKDEFNTLTCLVEGYKASSLAPSRPIFFIKCVRKTVAGETWIDNQSINWVIEAYRSQTTSLTGPRTQPCLSPKELAIVTCITLGKRNKEIVISPVLPSR